MIRRQESYSAPDLDPSTSKPLDVGIHGIELRGSSLQNDGFFEKGVLMAMESDHIAGGNMREVKVIANGHCHSQYRPFVIFFRLKQNIDVLGHLVTENCRRVRGVWLCFGGGG
jgi:hypothetical protein